MSNKVLQPIEPNPDERIYLICDSSNIGVSAWIAQMQDDGRIRPARFHYKEFHHAQMNYGITKEELSAIGESVRYFRVMLQVHPITIVTEHQSLVAFMSCLQTTHMIITWQESLSQLDITIKYIDGKKNLIADALSRTYKKSPCPSCKQSLLSTDHSNSTPVLPTTTTQHLTVNFATSPTLPLITTMSSQTTPNTRKSNMTGRYEDTDEYDPNN